MVGPTTIAAACADATAKTQAQHPDITVSGCTGRCGSLVLELELDEGVPTASIVAAETAIDADPSSVQISLVTTDGVTVALAPTAVFFQGVSPAATQASTQPSTGSKGKANKKGRGRKGTKLSGGKAGKAKSGKAKSGKAKTGKATRTRASFGAATPGSPVSPSTTMGLALVGAMLVIVGVASGLRIDRGHTESTAGVSEADVTVAAERSPMVCSKSKQQDSSGGTHVEAAAPRLLLLA